VDWQDLNPGSRPDGKGKLGGDLRVRRGRKKSSENRRSGSGASGGNTEDGEGRSTVTNAVTSLNAIKNSKGAPEPAEGKSRWFPRGGIIRGSYSKTQSGHLERKRGTEAGETRNPKRKAKTWSGYFDLCKKNGQSQKMKRQTPCDGHGLSEKKMSKQGGTSNGSGRKNWGSKGGPQDKNTAQSTSNRAEPQERTAESNREKLKKSGNKEVTSKVRFRVGIA